MARSKYGYCGDFYDIREGANKCKYVGQLWKTPKGFVIRIIAPYSGKVLHESAPFSGKEFKLFDTVNLGYAVARYYAAR